MLSEQDLYGRTPLHYAAVAGNIILLFLLTSNHWTISHKPQHYNIKDKDNMTALDILFETMPSFKPKNGKMVLKLPYNCNSVDWFKIFAFQAFSNLKDTNLIDERRILKFLRVSLKKNQFYLIYMIKVIFPQLYHLNCRKHVHWFLAQF